MTFKRLDFLKDHFSLIFSSIITFKMLFLTVTTAEGIAILSILTAYQVARIIDYKFPTRPDLFDDVMKMKVQIEDLDRELTALKFGSLRR